MLIHGGWSKAKALIFNVVSATTFLVGGIVAYVVSFQMDVRFLLPFAAGNFIYIAASDLVPEVNKHHGWARNVVHFGAFAVGIVLLLTIKIGLE